MTQILFIEFVVYVGVPVAFIVWVVLGVRSAQRHPIIVRLRTRHLAAAEPAGLQWLICGPISLTASDGTTLSTPLQLAYSPLGLNLRLQGPPPQFIRAQIYCVPWEFVECESTSKFGFFSATFCLCGFEDGFTIAFNFNKLTAIEFGSLLKQIATATRAG